MASVPPLSRDRFDSELWPAADGVEPPSMPTIGERPRRFDPTQPLPGANPETPTPLDAIFGLLMTQGLLRKANSQNFPTTEAPNTVDEPGRRDFMKKGLAGGVGAALGGGLLGKIFGGGGGAAAAAPAIPSMGSAGLGMLNYKYGPGGLWETVLKTIEQKTAENLLRQSEGKGPMKVPSLRAERTDPAGLREEHEWGAREAERGARVLDRTMKGAVPKGDPGMEAVGAPVNYGAQSAGRGSRSSKPSSVVRYDPGHEPTRDFLKSLTPEQVEALENVLRGKGNPPPRPPGRLLEGEAIDLKKDPRRPGSYATVDDIASRWAPTKEVDPAFNRRYEYAYEQALKSVAKGRDPETLSNEELSLVEQMADAMVSAK